MFGDRVRIKAIAISFVCYLALSIVAMAVVVALWLPKNVEAARIAQMAESDPVLLLWQNLIGLTLGLGAGALACRLGGGKGLRNSAALGVIFILYGVLGIFLHPSHPLWMQAGKVLSPVPIAMLGGWLYMRSMRSTPASPESPIVAQ